MDDPEPTTADRGVLLPHQLGPGYRFTVAETGLDWRPDGVSDPVRTHVITYDHAPSFRAFLCTEPDERLQQGDSFAFDRTQGSIPIDASRPLVSIDLELIA